MPGVHTIKTVSSLTMVMVMTTVACRQPYIGPVAHDTNSFLVVNGFLNSGPDSTYISLSRTRNLGDTVVNHSEINAQVSVLGALGELYSLTSLGNGSYVHDGLNLNVNEKYQLQILTSDGHKYLSDTISVTPTPPIDSISWKQDTTSIDPKVGVTIYANSHDPNNNTRYYQWDYEEDWEYRAAFASYYLYAGGTFPLRTPEQMQYQCYRHFNSTDLQLSSSAKLSEDIIYEFPLVFIPRADEKLGVKYSILVKQHSISRDAFDYWENLKKNTELTGSIFDPQPSKLTGNFHCLNFPDEPVLGYLSASNVAQQRLFIAAAETEHWYYSVPGGCTTFKVLSADFDQYFKYGGYVPTVPFFGGFWATLPSCADCTASGGGLIPPSSW